MEFSLLYHVILLPADDTDTFSIVFKNMAPEHAAEIFRSCQLNQ